MKTTAYVCVHGVGIHDSGALVADVQEAVRRGVAGLGGHLVERPAQTEACRSNDDDLAGGEMNDDGDLADVEREGLNLAGRELTGRAEVQVPGQDPFIAEFYDGWWDRGAPRPGFWQVLRWALRIAPLLLLNTAWLWFTDRFSETATKSLYGFAAAVLPAALFLALAPAAIVALPVLLLAAAAIPPWRRAVHTVIVDVIGDAWLYRSKELDQDVLPGLVRLARSAAEHADRVVLVGHSQGAELTRRAGLRLTRSGEAEPGGRFRFVWVGSGENQLNTVRALARTRWLPLVLWPYLLAWPVFIYPVLAQLFVDVGRAWDAAGSGHPGPAVAPALASLVLAISIVAFVGAGMLFTRVLARPARDAGRLPAGRSWYVQSLLDPVSFGSAAVRARAAGPGGGPPEVSVRYVPRHRHRPWWQEHISYFDKPETGEVLINAGTERPRRRGGSSGPRVPGWLLVVSGVAVTVVLTGGYLVGRWQWGLLLG